MSQPMLIERKQLLTVEYISLCSVHLLSALILDIKLAVHDNLHLMVCVLVHQRCALFKSVKAS